MQADQETLHKMLHIRHVTYQFNHRKPMSCPAMAQLLSNTLYYKRFFPYYTFNLCAGLDDEGEIGGQLTQWGPWLLLPATSCVHAAQIFVPLGQKCGCRA
jgi:20S proteasome alpha/beta subunit